MIEDLIIEQLKKSAEIKNVIIEKEIKNIKNFCKILVKCFESGGTLLIAGNGGSAADAQHIAAEFVGKFKLKKRKAFPALALNTNSSILTSIINDSRNDTEFSRQVEAFSSHKEDVLLVITTSGNSKNIIKAIEVANSKKIKTIGLLGSGGGEVSDLLDFSIIVPSYDTPRIQEAHITIGHIVCDIVEQRLVRLEE